MFFSKAQKYYLDKDILTKVFINAIFGLLLIISKYHFV